MINKLTVFTVKTKKSKEKKRKKTIKHERTDGETRIRNRQKSDAQN